MILEKLFSQRYRKTEPSSIFVLRLFVLLLLLVSLIGYTWLIIWGIYNDGPVVLQSLTEEDAFPVPNVIYDCTQFVIQPQISSIFGTSPSRVTIYESMGSFSSDLLFSKIPDNGLSSLELNFYTKDPNSDPSQSNIKFKILDSDYLIQSTFKISMSYRFKLIRRRKDIMIPSWENYIGLSSNLVKIPYFTSSKEIFPFQNDTPTSILKIIIEQPTYTVQVETDKRNKTVLSSLGLIGGSFGFAASIYALLFGTISIKPWGLIQKYGFRINRSVQTKLKDTLEYIPLVYRPESISLNNYELKKRYDSLQFFLTEYVVDVERFEKLYNSNVNNYKKDID
ncbi:9870_t:CDS:2 [Dentiscutata erythropus]|uniref:9870_t:CDS:1 n=1 Tax=Dentiscutata erythropus TaxID=1348616 RepID=A0A9N9J669_9GLOM|nr:9870_t:CDS:2 [Dentiscutata erythropus]